MSHLLTTFWPFLILIVLIIYAGSHFTENTLKKSLDEARQRADLQRQETGEFQRQLLEELRRHNTVMEQQSQLLARLLEREER